MNQTMCPFCNLLVKSQPQSSQIPPSPGLGALASVGASERFTAQGRWVQDREYGQQFRAEMLTSTPSSRVVFAFAGPKGLTWRTRRGGRVARSCPACYVRLVDNCRGLRGVERLIVVG